MLLKYERILLNIIARLVAFCGIMLYGFMLFGAYIQWGQNSTIHESLFTQIFYIIDFGIFISGLPPMLLVVYFLVLGKTSKDFGMGLLFVFGSIFIHFYVVGFSAHGSPAYIYIPLHFLELTLVLGLIYYWHRKYHTH
jgi:hypothetical protein